MLASHWALFTKQTSLLAAWRFLGIPAASECGCRRFFSSYPWSSMLQELGYRSTDIFTYFPYLLSFLRQNESGL